MTLNYWVIVESYPFPNGVVGGIPVVTNSLYLTKKQKERKRKEKVGRKPRTHLVPRGFLSRVGPRDQLYVRLPDISHLFIYCV